MDVVVLSPLCSARALCCWLSSSSRDSPRSRGPTNRDQSNTSSYVSKISSMLKKYPNLVYLHEALTGNSILQPDSTAVLEFKPSGVQRRDFQAPNDIRNYIDGNNVCKRRLFLLEGLPTDYVEIYGSLLRIDPYFFTRQLRTVYREMSIEKCNTSRLPSQGFAPTEYSFAAWYYELRYFGANIQEDVDEFGFSAPQDRKIDFTRLNGIYDVVGIVRRMASFWSRITDTGDWDGKFDTSERLHDHQVR